MFQTISISSLINQPDKDILFLVERIEDMEDPENIVYPHKHNFYEILWVTKGNSNHTIDYKIDSRTLFLSMG